MNKPYPIVICPKCTGRVYKKLANLHACYLQHQNELKHYEMMLRRNWAAQYEDPPNYGMRHLINWWKKETQ